MGLSYMATYATRPNAFRWYSLSTRTIVLARVAIIASIRCLIVYLATIAGKRYANSNE